MAASTEKIKYRLMYVDSWHDGESYYDNQVLDLCTVELTPGTERSDLMDRVGQEVRHMFTVDYDGDVYELLNKEGMPVLRLVPADDKV